MILSQKNDGSEEDTVAYIVGPSVFFFAFVIRCASAVITTFTTLNPDSRGDAVGFGNTAKAIAHGLLKGSRTYTLLALLIFHRFSFRRAL